VSAASDVPPSHPPSRTPRRLTPRLLLAAYVAIFAVLAINPYDRAVWAAENLPIVCIVTLLAATDRWTRFSTAAYLFMSVLVFMHTVGGHYTFERVPFGWVTELFSFERNHYDRIAHFSVGFFAYAIAELLERFRLTAKRWVTFLFAVFAIFTVASAYEIIEWLYAISADPAAGTAFLGSQGDVWDAQKDMLADGLGAIVAASIFTLGARPRPAPEPAKSAPGVA
jgi:putative membrane protein